MNKYSAKYINTNHSFVIENLPKGKPDNDEFYKSLCVLKNILQRGTITRLSENLIEIYDGFEIPESPLFIVDEETPDWGNRIKGDERRGFYPARTFLYHILPKCLPEYKFLIPLILPEAPVTDILKENEKYKDQAVDFLLPQAKLVIEIDGSQHKDDVLQRLADRERDIDLKNAGFTVVRILVSEINAGLTDSSLSIKAIKENLDKSSEIQYMKRIWENGLEEQEGYETCLELQEIMAYQMLMTELMLSEVLSPEDPYWEFNLAEGDETLFQIAFDDLFIWLKNLCELRDIHFEVPKLIFKDKSKISIDYSATKRWTDRDIKDKDTIYIRLDYLDKDEFCVCTADGPINDYLLKEPLPDAQYQSLLFFLRNFFGYEEFNDGQLSIIVSILRRKDTIGVLPTGSGKSLCYQIACLLQPSINFAVCPTVSLIQDQKRNLDEFGIDRTASISSDLSAEEREDLLIAFSKKKLLLIWISPERFQIQSFRDALGSIDSRLFSYAVIDEVHCLSEWGHDFRISYLTLTRTIRRYCSNIVLCGLTATVSQFVLRDIKKEFADEQGHEPLVKATGTMEREELTFYVERTDSANRYNVLKSLLNDTLDANEEQPSGVVFTQTVDGRNSACAKLKPLISRDFEGYETGLYHGKMSASEKLKSQDAFMRDETKCLVTTKAFGMGVNKKNIRYTVHYGIPASLEALYQEAGRAGRDRKESDCHILFDPGKNSNDVLGKIFGRKTKAEDINSIASSHRITGDLSTIFFFWTQSNRGVDAEIKSAMLLARQLPSNKNSNVVCCDRDLDADQLEKALYHFYLLGYVKDWTQESFYPGKETYTVYYQNQSLGEWKDHLLSYIRKYDPEFLIDPQNPRDEFDKVYQNLLDEGHYVELLITWLYDNIIYSRREMTKNVYDYCMDYTDSDSFKAKIDAYLKVSTDLADTMENIAGSPGDYAQWFNAFYETQNHLNRLNVVPRDPEEVFRTAQRFAESYRNNTGVNFVYSVSGMMSHKTSEREFEEIRDRFSEVFEWLEGKPPEVRNYVITETEKLLLDAKPASVGMFTEIILSKYPEYAEELYKKWGNDISFVYMMRGIADKLHETVGGFKW